MTINFSKQVLVFSHIDKTGGTTLDGVIAQDFRLKMADVYELPIYHANEAWLSAHRAEINRARYLDAGFPWALDIQRFLDRAGYFVTLLRDPVSRMVSDYYMKVRGGLVEEPIEAWLAQPDQTFNIYCKRFGGPEGSLERAIGVLDSHFEWVGITERYSESIFLLRQQLELAHNPLIKLNVRGKKTAVSDLPDEVVALIKASATPVEARAILGLS